MGGGQPAQRRAGVVESVGDFMRRRARETGDFARDAYERGREEWNEATRTGRALAATRPSDVVALGRKALDAGGRELDRTLGNSRAARATAGVVGWATGVSAGAGRAVVHTAEDLSKAAPYVEPLVNQYDPHHYQAMAATADGLADAAKHGGAYAADRMVHPERIGEDVRRMAHDVNVDLNPFAMPMGATPSAEFARRFKVGANDGEVGANVLALATGGGETRALARLAGVSEAMTAEKLMQRGYSAADAAQLGEIYDGMGSHYPISRALGKDLGLPQWIIDSPLNVSKPKVSRYEAYREHYGVDDHFHGARMRGRRGRGSGFSGKRAGFDKWQGLDRVWHGMSDAAKALGGAILGEPAGIYQVEQHGDEPW